MTELEIVGRQGRHQRVTLLEPEGGWTRDAYDAAVVMYVEGHGRAAQTVTMHPDTAMALALSEERIVRTATRGETLLVTSPTYPRRAITFYF